MIFMSGANWKVLATFGGVFGAGALGVMLFTNYMKKRIDAWLHPELYLKTGGWQPYQSLLAIGSGGLFGVGLGNSYQKHMWLSGAAERLHLRNSLRGARFHRGNRPHSAFRTFHVARLCHCKACSGHIFFRSCCGTYRKSRYSGNAQYRSRDIIHPDDGNCASILLIRRHGACHAARGNGNYTFRFTLFVSKAGIKRL